MDVSLDPVLKSPVSLYTAWALRVSSGLESTLSLPRGLNKSLNRLELSFQSV